MREFSREQNQAFECGFDILRKSYVGFCVQYIKTAFLFLLIDLEIALLVPFFVNTPIYEKSFIISYTIILLIGCTLGIMLVIEM